MTLGLAARSGLDRNHLRTKRYRHPHRNVYVPATTPQDLVSRCRAVGLVLPKGARFSHWTAAALYGAPIDTCDDLHVSVPSGVVVPRRRPGIVTHQRVLDTQPRLIRGLPVTCPGQTFLDLARELPRVELVVLGDFLVRRWTTPDAVSAYLADRPGVRGVVRARRAASLLRVGVDSPQETRLRLRIVDAGLPEPEVNPTITEEGAWLGRPDLAYRLQRIAIQFEGDVHRTSRRRWRLDIVRDERFQDAGWLVLRTVNDDVLRPAHFLHRLERALRERG